MKRDTHGSPGVPQVLMELCLSGSPNHTVIRSTGGDSYLEKLGLLGIYLCK